MIYRKKKLFVNEKASKVDSRQSLAEFDMHIGAIIIIHNSSVEQVQLIAKHSVLNSEHRTSNSRPDINFHMTHIGKEWVDFSTCVIQFLVFLLQFNIV